MQLFRSVAVANLEISYSKYTLFICMCMYVCMYIYVYTFEYLGFPNYQAKKFMKHLALKLYASTKPSRNRYVKRLGTDSLVVNQRIPKPVHIFD